MQFHYALVDDLLSREEFERRVQDKIEECGDLLDETAAAMLVVSGCGRHHVKVSGLSAGSTLFSFFAKVISRSPPKEFDRPEGEKGLVSTLILGDETGQVRAVLWDEKAMAATEIEPGEVLEVIGRHPPRSREDIVVLALRKAQVEIQCQGDVDPYLLPPERKDIDAVIVFREEPRSYTRRDGSRSEMTEAVIACREGSARLVCWQPDLLTNVPDGMPLRITQALEKNRRYGKEYSIDDRSSVSAGDHAIGIVFSPLATVTEDGTFSVKGTVTSAQPVRTFTSRDGSPSQVRNIVISDGKNDIRVVLWGAKATSQLIPGDHVAVFNGRSRSGKFGLELNIGTGSFLQVIIPDTGEEIELEGTVIVTRHGTFIDDGTTRYLVHGNLPHGREVRIRGILNGKRITPEGFEAIDIGPDLLVARIDRFLGDAGT